MDQDVLARFESCLLKCVVRGYENFRNGARGGPIEIRRHVAHCILMRCHKFSMGSATDDPHDAIAYLPALSVRAWLHHFAGKFKSGNVLRRAGRCRISTLPLQKICTVERSTPHVNEDFMRPRLRFRNSLDFQNLRSPKTINNNSFHGFTCIPLSTFWPTNCLITDRSYLQIGSPNRAHAWSL